MKIYFNTLGCSKNTVDSENTMALLEERGHVIVSFPEDAECIIVNTCAFINDAKEQSIDTVLEMAKYRENGAILVIAGCLSKRYANELKTEIPEADIILGVNEYDSLPDILDEYIEKGRRIIRAEAEEDTYCEIPVRKIEKGAYYSYIKISEGCNRVCSYCIIPSIRGHFRSRKMENIVREAELIAASGCSELLIIAQDTTAYGIDIYGEYKLAELLRMLCRIEGIHWIRLLYCYEDEITEELIDTVRDEDKICKYLDIPLQHYSRHILEDMNRVSTPESIDDTIEKLRKKIPDVHIRTTFITGFPGETKEDYEILESFIERAEFDRLGIFAYSQEENTIAGEMKNQIDEHVRAERRDSLMEMQRSISLKKNIAKIGNVYEVIVDEKEDEDTYIGRTQFDSPEIDDGVIFTSKRKLSPGEYVFVKITDAFDYDLVGILEE